MDCDICFEDKILTVNIAFFKCSHHVCRNCYHRLIKRLCPFCRRKIKILSSKQVDDKSKICIEEEEESTEEDDYYLLYQNDFVIPVIRKNRHEIKRKSKDKKRAILNSLLNENINNKILKLIPTLRRRKQKKLNLLLLK